jgi:gluconolactonase
LITAGRHFRRHRVDCREENMTRLLTAAAACALATSLAIAEPSDQGVLRLDPALDALVSPDAKVELVKGGFGFTEGPVWVQKGKEGYLLFTDIPATWCGS